MPHPLRALARTLERRRQRHQSLKRLEDALFDPHLARDLGLPHRSRRLPQIEKW